MVTTTRRGWPALEPALLAFAVVVCGSVSLLAMSHVSASDCHDRCDATTSSSHWTAVVTDQDPLDDGDDDDAPDAFVALPIVLTSDAGFGRLLIQNEFDGASTLRTGHLVPRGPPDWTRIPHHSAPHPQEVLFSAARPGSRHWTAAFHDSVDDSDDDGDNDDDDDGVDDVGDAIAAPAILNAHDDSHHPVVVAEFGVALTLQSENLAPRGPPVDRNLPAGPPQAAALNLQDSPDVDVNDSDGDDDDDAGELHGLSVAVTSGGHSILILSRFDDLLSFASHDLSPRAPPR